MTVAALKEVKLINCSWGRAFTSFLGHGLTNVPDFGVILDSAILLILFEFGLFGAIIYLSGLLLAVARNNNSRLAKADTFLGVSKSFRLWLLIYVSPSAYP